MQVRLIFKTMPSKRRRNYTTKKIIKIKSIVNNYDSRENYCNCLGENCNSKRMYMMDLIHNNRLPLKIGYDITIKYKDRMSTLLDIALDLDNKSYSNLLKKVGIKTYEKLINTDIVYATKWNNIEAVEDLIKKKVDLNKEDINNKNAMNYALEHNSYYIFDLLLKAGADYRRIQDRIPIMATIILYGKKECLKVAIRNGLDILNFLVDLDVYNEHLNKRVEILLECGLDINREIIFKISDDEKIMGNALILAAYLGNNEIIKILLNYGIDTHYYIATEGILQGCNSLHIASFFGNTKAIDLILKNSKMNINCLTNHNCNVLTLAATQCRINTVKYLLKNGVNVFQKTNRYDLLSILDTKMESVRLNQGDYNPRVNIDNLKKVKKMIQDRGVLHALTKIQGRIRKWWFKQKTRIDKKNNERKEKIKEKQKKRKKRKKEIRKEKKENKIKSSYTTTRSLLLGNKIIYTCKKCTYIQTSFENIREHVINCDHEYNEKHISLFGEWEKLDVEFGQLSSP
jgi:ankyrin repeat protein